MKEPVSKRIQIRGNIREQWIQQINLKILCCQNINFIKVNIKEVMWQVVFLKCQHSVLLLMILMEMVKYKITIKYLRLVFLTIHF